MTYAARFVIAGLGVRFSTACEPAYAYLRGLDQLANIRPFQALPDDPSLPLPTVRYYDSTPRHASFDFASHTLDVAFPWEAEAPELFAPGRPYRNLITYPLRLGLEWARQEKAQYTVHASAVTRDGHAIVFAGDTEAGKTTMALNMCQKFGFSIYANDQTVLSLQNGRPWIMAGDREIGLRFSSVSRYSPALADQVFVNGATSDAWEVKQDVRPQDLGILATADPVPLRLFVKIRLDDTLDDSVLQILSGGAFHHMPLRQKRALFRTKIDLHREITQVIRAAEFTPLRDADLSLFDLYLPSLDQPAFVSHRVEFLNTLFDHRETVVLSLRGPLEAVSRTVVKLFESPLHDVAALAGVDGAQVAQH